MIEESLFRLQAYIKNEDYKGYDQYDVLSSPIFSLPIANTHLVRFASQQVFRRLPFNSRKLLGITKAINPVTLGLSIQAYSYLLQIYPERSIFIEEIRKLKKLLILYQSTGYSGISWGYNFDWEARYAKINAFVPTSVATGIITNGLFENFKLTKDISSYKLCENASEFVLKDLNKSYEENSFCFSYSPVDKQFVYNASMKAARLLAQVYSINKDEKLKKIIYNSVKYVVKNQYNDGSWGYANHDARTWVDNYHTGYILDCLDDVINYTGLDEFKDSLAKGIEFYINNFFYKNELPKFRSNLIYPIDSTGVGQSLLTLTRFGYIDTALNVAKWSIENMQNKKGYFYFRKYKHYKNKISYMRWSNAWMFVGLSFLLYKYKIINK